MLHASGAKDEGMWVEGRLHGLGTRTNVDGSVLQGEWRENKLINGSGVLVMADGSSFNGTWVHGSWEGLGMHSTGENGFVYEGNFRNGQRLNKRTRHI